MTDQPPVQSGKGKKPWYRRWWVWGIAAVLLIGWIGSLTDPPEDEAEAKSDAATGATATESEEVTAEEVASEEPTTEAPDPEPTEEESEEPEEPEPDYEISETEGVVFVSMPVSESLTAGMIRSVAQKDTLDALEAAAEEYPDASLYWIQGYMDTVDQYGNEHEDTMVLNVGYEASTVEQINFDNIVVANIWDVADEPNLINENIFY